MRLSLGSLTGQSNERGQSSPVGVVLMLSMVIVGSGAIVSIGAIALQDTQQSLDNERAEKVLTQFDSQTAMVALGDSSVNQIALSRTQSAAYEVDSDAGWMNVSVRNTSTETTRTLMNETLGSVRYESGSRVVAYQGGGVWKYQNNGSLMVSPPEFYYREATLTLPLVTVSGDRSLGGQATVTKNGSSTQYFPNESHQWSNPLDNGKVNVTVHSKYYEAWGDFFEKRTDGNAVLDHENRTATLTLVVPVGPRTVSNAIAATSAGGEIKLAGSGNNETRTDSYNSSKGTGTYADTQTDRGTIRTAGDVTVKGNSFVNGSVSSGGFVRVKGQGEVAHDINYTDGKKITGTVGGEIRQISGVEGIDPIDSVVEQRYNNLSSENDNANESITGDTLDDSDKTLSPGKYYLDQLVLDGDTLTLDTQGERIVIAVRDYVALKNSGKIKVQGTGKVEFYVNGNDTHSSGDHFYIDNSGGVVDVATAQNSSQMWIYGKSDFQSSINGDGSHTQRFEGVIYAPAGSVGSSSFFIDKGHLYGGVVTGSVEMDNGGSVHYDRALLGVRAVPPNANIVRLTFLHISENPVNVTSG